MADEIIKVLDFILNNELVQAVVILCFLYLVFRNL